MIKTKNLLALALAALLVGGCNNNSSSVSSSTSSSSGSEQTSVSTSTSTASKYTLKSACEAVASLLSKEVGETIEVSQDSDGYYVVCDFSYTVEEVKTLVTTSLIPDGFIVDGTWIEDEFSDGTATEYIDYYCDDVLLEYDVYDEDGTCFQVVSYDINELQ